MQVRSAAKQPEQNEKQDRETDTDEKNADPASRSVPFIAVIAAEAASENEP